MNSVLDTNTLLLQREIFYMFTLETPTPRVLKLEYRINIIELCINIDHEVKTSGAVLVSDTRILAHL